MRGVRITEIEPIGIRQHTDELRVLHRTSQTADAEFRTRDEATDRSREDAVGAGADEMVMVCSGSSARLTDRTKNKPTDATIVGIIDTIKMKE
jgi:microcompartment protein CcmK/EutM